MKPSQEILRTMGASATDVLNGQLSMPVEGDKDEIWKNRMAINAILKYLDEHTDLRTFYDN